MGFGTPRRAVVRLGTLHSVVRSLHGQALMLLKASGRVNNSRQLQRTYDSLTSPSDNSTGSQRRICPVLAAAPCDFVFYGAVYESDYLLTWPSDASAQGRFCYVWRGDRRSAKHTVKMPDAVSFSGRDRHAELPLTFDHLSVAASLDMRREDKVSRWHRKRFSRHRRALPLPVPPDDEKREVGLAMAL